MRRASLTGTWSMGKTIAARNARMRAAITQWPTPVVTMTTEMQTSSMIRAIRPFVGRVLNNVSSRNIPAMKPLTLTIDNVRVTMVPAISLAFGKSNDRSTENADGATTALKKIAAPSQSEIKIKREALRKLIDAFNQRRLWLATGVSLEPESLALAAFVDLLPSITMTARHPVGPGSRQGPTT